MRFEWLRVKFVASILRMPKAEIVYMPISSASLIYMLELSGLYYFVPLGPRNFTYRVT